MKLVPMNELIDFGVRFMTKRSVSKENAEYLSQIVVETEAFRQTTHGVVQFKVMSDLLGKKIDPTAEPTVVQDHAAMALLDGNGCFGNLTIKIAKELAVKKAQDCGIGFVAVRNTEWIGALGMHLISIGRQGLIGQIFAQTSSCKDCAPCGGIDGKFSTNPMAIVFPTGDNPVLADFSTATMSLGAARVLISQGKKADSACFIDKAGKATNDPNVLHDGGSLMFAGGDVTGYKFYALSLFIEALTVLAGGSANNPDVPTHQSFSLMVIAPASFAGADYYNKEMNRFIGHVKNSRTRPGFQNIRLPGERGFAALAECRKNGVPLDEAKLEMLGQIAKDNGVAAIG